MKDRSSRDTSTTNSAAASQRREVFSTRAAFIFAAIGSAVGLGNIQRFPYAAHDSGGGAFPIPYLVALLTVGTPLLLLDLAIDHRFRGSAPKSIRRIKPWAEPIGWIQVGVTFFITVYYAATIAWSFIHAWKSTRKNQGSDAEAYFMKDFLQVDIESVFSLDFAPSISIVLLIVQILVVGVPAVGVDKGIGKVSIISIPLLTVLFVAVVIYSLTLDGATKGLGTFFTPDWSAFTDSSVWIATYGQIFFSPSVVFGIMLTYASYLKSYTNLTESGLATAFANSSFEVLAGTSISATLGFMATQSGQAVGEVAISGIGLAFIAFPTVTSKMPKTIGLVFGLLFFLFLVIVSATPLMPLFEVVVSAVKDKLNLGRVQATLIVGGAMAVISLLAFPTTPGLATLDIVDKFANNVSIVLVILPTIIAIDWILHRTNEFAMHFNAVSSFKVGTMWQISVGNITPVILAVILFQELIGLFQENYEGYSDTQIDALGWGVIGVIFIGTLIMAILSRRGQHRPDGPPGLDFDVTPDFKQTSHLPRKHTPETEEVQAKCPVSQLL